MMINLTLMWLSVKSFFYILFRSLLKSFLRKTTKLCELQRICYGAETGARRTHAAGFISFHCIIMEFDCIAVFLWQYFIEMWLFLFCRIFYAHVTFKCIAEDRQRVDESRTKQSHLHWMAAFRKGHWGHVHRQTY